MTSHSPIFDRARACWGEERSSILEHASILVAGAGGLGCVVADLLVRSGIGNIILVDSGTIDAPDIGRQMLYKIADLGRPKVELAAQRLTEITGLTRVYPICHDIKEKEALQSHLNSLPPVMGIMDCLDNFASRFSLEELLDDRMFLVHGGVEQDFGQVTTIVKKQTLSLRKLFAGCHESTARIPVIPHIVYNIGSLMVYEALKNLWGAPELVNQILIVELSDFSMSKITLSP